MIEELEELFKKMQEDVAMSHHLSYSYLSEIIKIIRKYKK